MLNRNQGSPLISALGFGLLARAMGEQRPMTSAMALYPELLKAAQQEQLTGALGDLLGGDAGLLGTDKLAAPTVPAAPQPVAVAPQVTAPVAPVEQPTAQVAPMPVAKAPVIGPTTMPVSPRMTPQQQRTVMALAAAKKTEDAIKLAAEYTKPVKPIVSPGREAFEKKAGERAAELEKMGEEINAFTNDINRINELHSKYPDKTGWGAAVSTKLGLTEDPVLGQLNTLYGNVQMHTAKTLMSGGRGGIGLVNFAGIIKPQLRYKQAFNQGSMKEITQRQKERIEAIQKEYRHITGKDYPYQISPVKDVEAFGGGQIPRNQLSKLPVREGYVNMVSPDGKRAFAVPIDQVDQRISIGYRRIGQ